jgi:hypothetical protein
MWYPISAILVIEVEKILEKIPRELHQRECDRFYLGAEA